MCQTNENINEYPWLLFKLYGVAYAVSSKEITAIAHLPSDVTIIPNKAEHIRGVMEFRGSHIKLIDMRALLGVDSLLQEHDKFVDMLECRKEDHIRWINELERCVETNEKFKLATDPHKCKFGKWYDNFKSNSQLINFHLKKIEEPHEKFHAIAKEVVSIMEADHTTADKKEKIATAIERGKQEYMSKILSILEDAKEMFSTNIQEMVIAFEDKNGEFFGVIVDEVLSVDEVEVLNGNNVNNSVLRNHFVNGIARTIKTKELVLMLDYTQLYEE